MNLKILFFISALLQLSTWAFMLTLDFNTRSVQFYIIEMLTVANIAYLIFFYRKVHRPIQALTDGLDLLKGQDWNSTLNKVGQPEVDKIASTFNTMISRLKEQRLRFEEQSHFLNLLIGKAPIGVIIMAFDNSIAIANPAAGRLFDTDFHKMPGLKLAELPGLLGDCIAGLAIGGTQIFRADTGATYKCSRLILVDKGIVHSFYLIEDVGDAMATAERTAYEKIIRIIAHEVNNTVAPIATTLGIVNDVIEQSQGNNDWKELLSSCSERAIGMSDFVSRLADVVRIPEPNLQRCRIEDIIRRNTPFLESLCMPSGCRLTLDLAEDTPDCLADIALIEQVLVNIVKNAAESIARTGKNGEVRLTTVRSESGSVQATIADNGAGIDHQKSLKIFTPFYTDKPGGQGVGLTFVREVLRRHKCTYSLRTDPDGQTRFSINFPSATR